MTTELVSLTQIDDNPFQSRQDYSSETIEKLAADIRQNTLLQTPVGRRVGDRVQLALGHRRKRAFDVLATEDPTYQQMPVEIRELADQEMALFAWSENAQRQDLNPLEKAQAIRRMMEAFGWTQTQVAKRLGMSRSAVTNALRLLRLSGEAREQLEQGNLSERQALALLPVLELPEPAQEQVQSTYYGSQIRCAIKNPEDYSSKSLRRIVSSAIQYATNDLSDAIFPLDQPVGEDQEGIRSLLCADCDLRVRRGKETLCGDVTCYRAKTLAWTDWCLAEVSGALGIPAFTPAEKEKLSYRDYDNFQPTSEGQAALERALEQQCSNLRIAYYPNGYVLRPDGYDDVGYVCVHPGKRDCACQKAARQEIQAEEIAAEKERKRRLREIKDRAVTEVAAALSEGQTGAMRAVLVALSSWSNRDKAMTIADHQTILQKIARILLNDATYSKDPDRAETQFQEWAEKTGIVPVANTEPDPLAQVNRHWVRINAWMRKLTSELPMLEAVRGNIVNLSRLAETLEKVVNGRGPTEQIEDLARKIAQTQDTLEALLPAIESWNGDNFGDVSWLVTVPAGDVNFRSSLERATVPVIRYALALTRGREGNKTRVQALERKLRKLEA